MIQPHSSQGLEYRFLKFPTHDEAEKALNKWSSDGWQLVAYQAAAESDLITHFLVVSREAKPEGRRLGFG